MFPGGAQRRSIQVAVIFQALVFSLVAFNLRPRIVEPFAPRLPVADVRLVGPADAIPSVTLNRSAKSFASEIRAIVFGAKVYQPVQPFGAALAPNRRAPFRPTRPLVSSVVIRAPPAPVFN